MRKSLALVFLVYLFTFSVGHSMEEQKKNLGFYFNVEHLQGEVRCSFYRDSDFIESFLLKKGSTYQNYFSEHVDISCTNNLDYVEFIVYEHGSSSYLYEKRYLDVLGVSYEIEHTKHNSLFYSFPLFIVFFTLVMYIKNYSTRIDEEDPYL